MQTTYHNYDKFPYIKAEGKVFSGFEAIKQVIVENNEKITVLDCYPIVDVPALVNGFDGFFDHVFYSDTCAYSGDELTAKMQKNLTDDRIFGVMTTDRLPEFFIQEKLEKMRRDIVDSKGKILVIGVGAMLVWEQGLTVHCSLAR